MNILVAIIVGTYSDSSATFLSVIVVGWVVSNLLCLVGVMLLTCFPCQELDWYFS